MLYLYTFRVGFFYTSQIVFIYSQYFFPNFPYIQILQENTEIVYDWSFVLGWLGVFSSLAGSFLFLFSSCCLAGEKEREEMNNVQYIMPGLCLFSFKRVCRCSQVLRDNSRINYDWSYMLAWVGVGWLLVAAMLFSGGAICLRGEREREENINMQYIMPGNTLLTLSLSFFLHTSHYLLQKRLL